MLHAERTFFGVYRLTQDDKTANIAPSRMARHCTACRPCKGSEAGEPLTYYHRAGPFGQAFAGLSQVRPPQQVAVIGLGVGTLAAYAQPGQRWTFYEIDEAVERIARDANIQLPERCGERCRIVIGDARLSLARCGRPYDVLVLDAFSSDSIPMHLLTSEALSVYQRRLKPAA